MNFRCFDLGGSGLKTCIFRNAEREPECLVNLGVSDQDDIGTWIRDRLPTLDHEIADGFVFSFSLAGLDKLSKSRKIPNQRDSMSISRLFRLPIGRVFTLNDGDSHLVASQTCLQITEFPQVNLSVGTGVGIGMYDETGGMVPENDVRTKLGKNIWDFVTDSSASRNVAGFALAKDGFNELRQQDPPNAILRFEKRWLKFIEHKLIPALGQLPRTITLTGGIVEAGQLFTSPQFLQTCLIRSGPKHAGLLGTKLYAES